MIKIGITGVNGFIGSHLFNSLNIVSKEFKLIPFEKTYFQSSENLDRFVSNCDIIVHLAAMNRHPNPKIIYNTNIDLVKILIVSLEKTQTTPQIIFASSIQEELNNYYGNSKKDGGNLLDTWAKKNNSLFTKLLIPNVFGPFGKPLYNSVIATFCHQLAHGEKPKIDVDGELKLIYVGELVEHIIKIINTRKISNSRENNITVKIQHTKKIKVSEILKILGNFKKEYYEKGIFPNLNDTFTKNLFNTFVCYIDHSEWFPFILKKHTDDRGSFVETIKLNSGGQVSFSTTAPGITRGNHYHTRKAERFAVIKGKAMIELRRIGTEDVLRFKLNGESPSFVDMPIWYTHNITNIGQDELITIFWINEEYNQNDPDTFFEEV